MEPSRWPHVAEASDGTLTLVAAEGVTSSVVRALADGAAPPPPFSVRSFAPLPAASYEERPITVDQTNHSVIVGESVVVKWFPRPVRGPHPALGPLAHLADFARTARPYAAIFWEDAPVALVTAYLPDARDGWEWCVDEAVRGGMEFAAEIGRLAAELHLAMATPSRTFPDPVRLPPAEAVPVVYGKRAEEALDAALALTASENVADSADGAWLAARAAVLRGELVPLALPVRTPLIRIHGDLHVGQILRWRGGYAVVDFDGNPTVAADDAEAFQPAARDLAQLATSLDHVGQVAIRRRTVDPAEVARWVTITRSELVGAYTAALDEAGRAELLDRSLLRPFEIEQECRELIYAARHLPRWRYAPMGVLRSWFT
ncbi:hypothetical protein [Sphaerimonospora thailandensis]|uniref:Glucosamine kinase n=1 Tax=Sphaerimonospora thailandensis TaxID=795644 RepID=A0A8J3R7B5_9ACTN|nr:hypothetical protein [Sphaerimonospora thailandensis]GIH68769.1 hypothetical protein Mth01_10220 [Sphaerimonospora thailandensis]